MSIILNIIFLQLLILFSNNEIIHPITDHRKFKLITLENKIKVKNFTIKTNKKIQKKKMN